VKKIRSFKQIYTEYGDWLSEKNDNDKYKYKNMIEEYGEQLTNVLFYKDLLAKCYDKDKGLFYFSKFVIGGLTEIGYPSPFRYNTLLRKWHKLVMTSSYVAVECARGHGKELADSTPIFTTDGWKTHGELNIGDFVFGIEGKPIKIIGKSDKHQDDYVVTTRNGEKIRCHGNHEWTVFDSKSRTIKTLETKEIANSVKWLNNRNRYLLSNIKPLQFKEKDLPLNAYYLGLWLGDGNKNNTNITHSKEDIESINSIPYKISNQWKHKITGVLKTSFAKNNIVTQLRNLNVFNNKHIPDIYMNSSIEQRLELLAGLIDSNGSVNKNGYKVRFTNTNKKLIDNVMHLLHTLGFRPHITSQEPKKRTRKIIGRKTVYTISFIANLVIPTRLPRKKITVKKLTRNSITSVKYEPNGELGNCITVDSDDGLYLVGKKMIPTHNSVFFSQILNIYDMFLFKFRRVILISASQDQATELLENMKIIIENNEWLTTKRDPNKWAGQKIGYNGGYVMTAGIGSEILGQHVDRILIDDILRSDNKLSDEQIEDYIDMNLSPMLLNRNGQLILVGTPKSDKDIFSEIQRRIKKEPKNPWLFRKYPAIIDYDKKILQCPDRFSWEQIMEKRLTMGSLKFGREYQLEFFSRKQSLFPTSLLNAAKRKGTNMMLIPEHDKRGPEWMYVMGVDVARSGSVSADYTVAITLAYNSVTQEKQIVNVWREKGMKISEQSYYIAKISRAFDNCQVLVEQNNIGINMIDTLADEYNVGVETFITGGKGQKKEELIRFLITAFEHEQISFPQADEWSREQLGHIEGELSKFAVTTTPAGNETFRGIGAHDDCVMSLALANKATQILGAPFAVSDFNGGGNIDGNMYKSIMGANQHESDLVRLIKLGIIK